MNPPKLFYNSICPPCRSILLLTRMLKINLHQEKVDILTKNYVKQLAKINPRHTLPVLQDRDLYICDSHSIGPYLIKKFTNNVTLYPEDLSIRAIVDQWLHYDSGVLYPTLYRAISPILFRNQYGISFKDISHIERCYSHLNNTLKNRKWLLGNTLTFADLSSLSTISTLDMLFPVNSQSYSWLAEYIKSYEHLPHYIECNLAGLTELADVIRKKLEKNSKIVGSC